MVSDKPLNPQELGDDEAMRLVDFVREMAGAGICRAAFVENALDALEDIPGFETMRPAKANRIVRQLWSLYSEQEDPQN